MSVMILVPHNTMTWLRQWTGRAGDFDGAIIALEWLALRSIVRIYGENEARVLVMR